MRGHVGRAMAALALAATAAAAQAKVEAKVESAALRGKWNVDKQAVVEAGAPPEYTSATPEKKKEMLAQAVKGVPDMTLEFTEDTIRADMGSGDPQVATYKVTKVEARTVYFDATAKGAPEQGVEKMSGELVDADTMRLSKVGDPVVLLLRRAKP